MEQGSSTNRGLCAHPGFYLPLHLPWLSGIAKLTVFAVSSEVQLNSSCTLPVLTSSNLHTDGGTQLRNVLQMICVLLAYSSSTLLLFPLGQVTWLLKYFFKRKVLSNIIYIWYMYLMYQLHFLPKNTKYMHSH